MTHPSLGDGLRWDKRNIAPGAQTVRSGDAGPVGASLGGKIPPTACDSQWIRNYARENVSWLVTSASLMLSFFLILELGKQFLEISPVAEGREARILFQAGGIVEPVR